jgi:hypothetical protein
MKMKKIIYLIIVIFVAGALTAPASAQKRDYQAGEKIEYKPNPSQDIWEEGVFVEPTYDGSQPVIRTKPTQYFPQGEQKAVTWDAIRPLAEKPLTTVKTPDNKTPDEDEAEANTPPTSNRTGGQGVMTRADVIGYLRAHLPNDPDAPNAEEVRKQLIEEIKQRGVNFHEKNPGEIYTVGGYSVANNIPDAINSNLGAPVSQDWLMGRWTMYVMGGTNYYVNTGNGAVISREAVAKLGFLTINPGGTYIWKVEPGDPPAQYVKGAWRQATKEEMGFEGGAGIVLQRAADGADWIVMKYMSPNVKTDNIEVEHIVNRGTYRRVGERSR